MEKKISKKLKDSNSLVTAQEDFTDDQLDALIIHLAQIARGTLDEFGIRSSKDGLQMFDDVLDKMSDELRDRVEHRVVNCAIDKINRFWDAPADAVNSVLMEK